MVYFDDNDKKQHFSALFHINFMTLIQIYTRLKTNYALDVVAIQHGLYCRLYDHDASWANEQWGWRIAEHKYKGEVKYIYTGFMAKNKKLYAKRFEDLGMSFAIVGIKDYVMGASKPPFERYVELSSNAKILGMSFGFIGKAISKKNQKTPKKEKEESENDGIEFLEGIIAGVNISTGEQLANDSAWKHHAIQEDIQDYLKSKK